MTEPIPSRPPLQKRLSPTRYSFSVNAFAITSVPSEGHAELPDASPDKKIYTHVRKIQTPAKKDSRISTQGQIGVEFAALNINVKLINAVFCAHIPKQNVSILLCFAEIEVAYRILPSSLHEIPAVLSGSEGAS